MRTRLAHVLVGFVALALFAGSVYYTWAFLQGSFEGGRPVLAAFSDPGVGQQLPEGGDVKVRGVLVGRIADISYENGEAIVELRLDAGTELPLETEAEIRSKTVFGQKWVELIPPPQGTGSLIAAGAIPDERTTEPLELERALQLGHDLLSEIPLADLATVFSELADGFAGREGDAGTAIDKGLVALRAVNSRSEEFDLALRQLNEFSIWLDDNDDDLVSFMSSLDAANRALVGAAPEFRSNLQSVPIFFDDLADFQADVEGSLGRLVEDGATLAEILAARTGDIRSLLVNLQAFTTVWNSGLSQPCGGLFEERLTCWRLYQMPGLESRGLYRQGQAPDEDEPGDPNFGPRRRALSALELLQRWEAAGSGDGIAAALLAPLAALEAEEDVR